MRQIEYKVVFEGWNPLFSNDKVVLFRAKTYEECENFALNHKPETKSEPSELSIEKVFVLKYIAKEQTNDQDD